MIENWRRRLAAELCDGAVKHARGVKRVGRERGVRDGLEALERRIMLTGAAAQLVFLKSPSSIVANYNSNATLTVAIEDASGNTVTTDSSQLGLTFTDASGQNAGSFTMNTVDGVGYYPFTASGQTFFTQAGTYTATISDTSDSLPLISANFTVSPAAASQVVFLQQPALSTTGNAISPAVQVAIEDQWGNIVTSDNSYIHITKGSGVGTVGGNTELQAVNGVATFTGLTVNAAGNYTLKAQDDASASIGIVTSQSFTVATPVATNLVFLQAPSSVDGGWAFPSAVEVAIEDQAGNIMTGATSSITISAAAIDPVPVYAMTGTLTEPAVNGVATFSGLTIGTPETYQLEAMLEPNGGRFWPGPNIVVNDVPAVLEPFAPTTVTAGKSLDMDGFVIDGGGNVIGDNSTLTLSVISGPGKLSGNTTVANVGGVFQFNNATLATAGSYVLGITDSAKGLTTTLGMTVVAGAPAQLVFLQVPPTSIVAGSTMSPAVTVAIEDQAGNVVTGDNADITIALVPQVVGAPGSLLYGTTTVQAVNGVATFSDLRLTAVWEYGVYASDPADGLTSAQVGVAVAAAAASQLGVISQPTSATAGVPLQGLELSVEDAFENSISDGSVIRFTVASGPGELSGTTTGSGSFSNLTLDTAGTYVLQATDPAHGFSVDLAPIAVEPGAASKLVFMSEPTGPSADENVIAIIAIIDQFDNLVSSDHSTVVLSAIGPGSLSGTVAAPAANGVVAFGDAELTTAGGYQLVASDAADGLTVTSDSFVVHAGAAAELVFGQQPGSTTAGSVLRPAVSVMVEDDQGNVVTSDTSNVTLAVGSGPGVLSGTTTIRLSNGVAAFSGLSLTTPGNYTLAASDASDGLSGLVSNGFAVSTGAAAKLAFVQQPENAAAGVRMGNVRVAVEDGFGNVVTGDVSNVTLSVHGGTAALGGTLTAAVVNGVATFADLSMTTAGTYSLTAADVGDGLSGIASGNFVVSAATAAQLVLLQGVTGTMAAGALVPTARVAIEDAFGNVETGDKNGVTVSVASGPGELGGTVTVAAVQGVATFSNLSLTTAGMYALVAGDGAEGLSAALGNVTVSAGAAAHVAFTQVPTAVEAGGGFGVTVQVTDAAGNGVDGAVTLSASGVSGGALTGFTTVQAVDGVAVFAGLVLSKVGTYVLQATAGSATGASGNVVADAPATHLGLTTKSLTVGAGAAIPALSVQVVDAKSHLVLSDASQMHVVLTGTAGGVLAGTTTVTVENGAAVFSGLSVTKAGTYSLTFADGALKGVKLAKVTVAADVGSARLMLSLRQAPGSVAAGSALVPVPVVTVEDRYGNVLKSDKSKVTLSVVSGAGGLSGATTVGLKNGVGTFKGVSLTAAGDYALQVSGGGAGVASFAETVTTLGTTVGVPKVAAAGYGVGQAIGLATSVKGVGKSKLVFGGTASVVDADGEVLGTANVSAKGTVAFVLTGLAAGSYACTVRYEGDAAHAGASSGVFVVRVNG